MATVAAACGGSAPSSTDVGAGTGDGQASVAAQDDRDSGDGSTAADAGDDVSDVPADTPAADVPPALDFTVETLAGGTLDGADLAGGDVLLWFWAPW